MLAYLRRRLFTAALTLLGVVTVVFMLVRLLPGDPAETMLAHSGASPQAVAALRAELGLNRPLPVQYADWLAQLAHGDLGRSLYYNEPVTQLIAQYFPFTLRLALAALGWALLMGPALGVIAAYWVGRWPDRLAMLLAVGGATIPIFWSGLLLIWLFSVRLGWLPATGVGAPLALLMPSLVLGFAAAGPIARLTRATLSEALAQPYIMAARAKGLSRARATLRHGLRNVLAPLITVTGLQLSFLLGGTFITETVFNRPGLGRLLVDAILNRDLPVVQGVALIVAGFYVLVNLAVDMAAGRLDPQAGWQ
jgi:ABC-type dipeptide/oligopeptide/nickel transport system permease component